MECIFIGDPTVVPEMVISGGIEFFSERRDGESTNSADLPEYKNPPYCTGKLNKKRKLSAIEDILTSQTDKIVEVIEKIAKNELNFRKSLVDNNSLEMQKNRDLLQSLFGQKE